MRPRLLAPVTCALAIAACAGPPAAGSADAAGGASTSTTPGDGGGSVGGGDASGGGAAPASCSTVDAPLGVLPGEVLDPAVELEGLVEGAIELSSIAIGDLRDCDGRAGVHAVLVIVARSSCATCRREAETLREDAAGWAEHGVRTVVLLESGDVAAWRSTYGLDEVAVLADPEGTLRLPEPPSDGGGFTSTPNGTPLFVVLDPRTGIIADRHLGADYDFVSLLALADANAG